jgi:hypothetical protein
LCGVSKNILLVIASVLIWDTTITPLQGISYGIALIGMILYRVTWEELKDGLSSILASYRRGAKSPSYGVHSLDPVSEL